MYLAELEKMMKEKTDKELSKIIDEEGYGEIADGYLRCRKTIFKVLKEYAGL
jgi:hypothetical protein